MGKAKPGFKVITIYKDKQTDRGDNIESSYQEIEWYSPRFNTVMSTLVVIIILSDTMLGLEANTVMSALVVIISYKAVRIFAKINYIDYCWMLWILDRLVEIDSLSPLDATSKMESPERTNID